MQFFKIHSVLDIGSYRSRSGRSDETSPSIDCRSIVCRFGDEVQTGSIPDDTNENVDVLPVLEPKTTNVDNSLISIGVRSWPDMELLLAHLLEQSDEQGDDDDSTNDADPVLLAESLPRSLSEREYLTQMLFERFDVPAVCFVPAPLLAVYASGVSQGMVIDVGFHSTRVSAVVEGRRCVDACVPVGGQSITTYTQALLAQHGVAPLDIDAANAVKERGCYLEPAEAPSSDATYTLPDGSSISAPAAALSASALALFEPTRIDVHAAGLADVLRSVVSQATSPANRNSLLASTVLCGGGGELRGLDQRVARELRVLATSGGAPARLTANELSALQPLPPAGRCEHAVWLGGALAAQSSALHAAWLLKRDYDEHGPASINAKCLF